VFVCSPPNCDKKAYYAVVLEDNSIRLIDSLSRELRNKIKGIAFGNCNRFQLQLKYVNADLSQQGAVPPVGLNVDPVHHRIVLNSKYGSLQFYNLFEDS